MGGVGSEKDYRNLMTPFQQVIVSQAWPSSYWIVSFLYFSPMTHVSSAYCNMNPKEVATTGFISQETLDAERAALATRSIGLDNNSEDDSWGVCVFHLCFLYFCSRLQMIFDSNTLVCYKIVRNQQGIWLATWLVWMATDDYRQPSERYIALHKPPLSYTTTRVM